MIVVGSPNSSNSNRLREVAANAGIPAYLVDRAVEVKAEWLVGRERIGVTAGASAPEVLVREVVEQLRSFGDLEVVEQSGIEEHVTFPLPKNLLAAVEASRTAPT
jgi:4-hydroxy-3-methylbut-2-enyl diphosphate reductase